MYSPPAPSGSPQRPTGLMFEPHSFFARPWWGTGEFRSPAGRFLAKYRLTGEGRMEGESAVVSQRIVMDGGDEHLMEWEVLSTDPEHYVAREISSGVTAKGRQCSEGFTWTFWMKAPTPMGAQWVRSTVTYAMETATTARSVCFNRLWGLLPISTVTTFYSHAH